MLLTPFTQPGHTETATPASCQVPCGRDLCSAACRTSDVTRLRSLALAVCIAALVMASGAAAKGYTTVVLIGADGQWAQLRGSERDLDAWIDWAPKAQPVRGGYLRLFFVGLGEFPANPARYYPAGHCVALDWPRPETVCHPLTAAVAPLFMRASALRPFSQRVTTVRRVTYLGTFKGMIHTAGALAGPLELALDRRGRAARQPAGCYAFKVAWTGPAQAARPGRVFLCRSGAYAEGMLYPLRRGVWEWFDLNVR